MALLHILAYAGGLAAFLFVTLSLASGLLWLAELIEEHSKYAKSIGTRAIYVIISLHVLLYFTDSLPIIPVLFSIICHLVYLQNFSSSWPYISLTSLKFILSCVLVIADHFIWFFHFAHLAQESKKFRTNPSNKYRYSNQNRSSTVALGPSFGDVAAFFAVCVWFVPLFLFLSLSANDNALPHLSTLSSGPASPSPHSVDLSSPGPSSGGTSSPTHRQIRTRSSTSLVKSVLNPLLSLLPRVRRSGGRKNEEGLIAPRTPVRGSPLHSPVIMPQQTPSYFPWDSSEDTSSSNSPSHLNLNLGVNGNRSVTPPPPRRIQSELFISKNTNTTNPNPRGIATRNGQPASPIPAEQKTEIIERPKRSSPLGSDNGLTRRKAD
ncbi:hypothetical protein L486_02803 [Kwoniella mangroviensis CBS 10435]|uniref:Endoplasmic reticulum protein n=1 Tax=Kwoniella mangroviensis CBS 10435 TaxID=1331196 RepID=A0A1B9IX72_9TREE|nr:uncharacterized protein I203_01361 [Kwoniella mangroviensis CBS 8507]OCF60123.1 hypothetical protein L486_02803 [Kwoniella mangroviensis CBS 10435]OCF69504.1 hypothetical protein I203_01361 [Kwoniella mangroviensis CBS 8507]OCF72288.1 hypothetical protein I204_06667 [Kwoniella mangroviensis CBS 8886]